jgi:putative aminopeptidase FrvX
MNTQNLTSLIFELCSEDGIISKHPAFELALQKLKQYTSDAHFDRMGNIIATIHPPKEGSEHIMLEAHLDEIGFVVTSINKEGFLLVDKVGGVDPRVLLSQEVTVHGKQKLYGVFCSKPPHLSSAEDYKKAPALSEMAIDIGMSYEKACEAVSPGDFVFLRRSPMQLANGLITSKALDDRAGVASLLRTLELLQNEEIDCGLTVVFAISEECGERGAKVAAFAVAPTISISVDVSHGLTPDAPAEKCGELQKGPMIGISPVLSREVTAQLLNLAEQNNIKYQKEIMASQTGTNSDVISISREGVKSGLVSIPLRYMHTAAEVIATLDVEATAKLLAQYVKSIKGAQTC